MCFVVLGFVWLLKFMCVWMIYYCFVPLNRILLNVVGRSSIAAIASLVVHCTVVFWWWMMHSCNRQSNSSPLRNSREPVNKKGPFINTYIRLDWMDVGVWYCNSARLKWWCMFLLLFSGIFYWWLVFVVFLLFAKNNCSREVMMCRMTMLNCSWRIQRTAGFSQFPALPTFMKYHFAVTGTNTVLYGITPCTGEGLKRKKKVEVLFGSQIYALISWI